MLGCLWVRPKVDTWREVVEQEQRGQPSLYNYRSTTHGEGEGGTSAILPAQRALLLCIVGRELAVT